MFIQEIVVDGFKSYAHRTVIEGFDPHFNAITGLNGSGKSNILDAICFVLGITNLSQVRAGNLSELVYKQGQAGVNKATVTVVFNNEEEANSPVGYEQCPEVTVTRQVMMGGKSKYLINGRNAPAGQVQNLFHSVQLNVNNPHFLIMQGRITKVLNMKPHEILGMVEEAAGTRMYETKRVAALKTIDKKQAKLDELNSILEEEITPTLERLRGEKEGYLKFSKMEQDVARMERFVVASEYMNAVKALEDSSGGTAEMERKIVELEETSVKYRGQIKAKDVEIAERSAKLKGQFEEQHKDFKAVEQKHSNELVRVTSAWKNAKENVGKAEIELESAQRLLEETAASVASKDAEMKLEHKSIDSMLQLAKEAEQTYQQMALDYQNMSAGISSSQGDEGRTLPEQISKAHSDSKTAEAKVQQAKMKITHLSKELKSVEKQLKSEGKSAEKLEAKCEAANRKVAQLKSQIENLNFSDTEFAALEHEKAELETFIVELSERCDFLSTQLQSRLRFKYNDPVRGFDRSKVKGLVAKLIQVKDQKHATALEVAAGGKLFHVVVDEAITGKALLDRGKLERRVTIIPLDKISSRPLSDSTCKAASSVAESLSTSAYPAIELVGFDEEVRTAVEYVFGSTIIVDGMKAANQICDNTKTRTVTLEGDVYDPSGTISGGSRNQLGTTLTSLSEIGEVSAKLQTHQSRLKNIDGRLTSLKTASQTFEKLNVSLELAEAELEAAKKHLSQTSFGVLVEKRSSMTEELRAAEQQLDEMDSEKRTKWDLYETLQEQETELTQQRESRLSHIEKELSAAKVRAIEQTKQAREAESRSQNLALELESLKAEVVVARDGCVVSEKAVEDAMRDESDIQMKVGEVQALYEEAREHLDLLEKQMTGFSSEVNNLKRQRSDLIAAEEALKVESKKVSLLVERTKKERSGAEKVVSGIMKAYPWIQSEKTAFGISGGDYDFEATNPSEVSKQLKEMKKEHDSLSKKVNKKVMSMIEKAENEYTELLRKRKVVENDKKKIQNVIKELDIKKKAELERTWVKVNRDFGSIFSTLLPGSRAKLEPPEGLEAWEGLEVKVAFGDVWKESLSELSGGQRSLLALSLILALLLFKPAPMYILDEVDAALDLSHTQNIGNMLKTHFSQSQFVVVSLKEGMFNNANVIFRTKFVDGVSTVTRTIGTGSSRGRAFVNADNMKDSNEIGKTSNIHHRKGKENKSH